MLCRSSESLLLYLTMKVIVFDTETTGLPSPQLELDKQPYICQFAAVIWDCDLANMSMRELSRIDELIKPPIVLGYDSVAIHGITNKMLEDKPGFREVADMIIEAFHSADVAVAHNLNFDKAIIQYELERLNRSGDFLPEQIFDTMLASRDLCQLPGRHGNFKAPRLGELYSFLFGESFENAHNALSDVLATSKCLEELMKRQIFVPEEVAQDSLF